VVDKRFLPRVRYSETALAVISPTRQAGLDRHARRVNVAELAMDNVIVFANARGDVEFRLRHVNVFYSFLLVSRPVATSTKFETAIALHRNVRSTERQ